MKVYLPFLGKIRNFPRFWESVMATFRFFLFMKLFLVVEVNEVLQFDIREDTFEVRIDVSYRI